MSLIPLVLAALLAPLGLVAVPAAALPTAPDTVTADQLPTWQVNGVVWKMATVGNTVYVVGSFTKARPPGVAAGGAGEVDANNAFAFDIVTGERVAAFAPQLNGQVLVAEPSPDGAVLYIGGDFTTVDGQARAHLAAFDTATGQLTPWAPGTDGQVRALAVNETAVYVGGNFRAAGSQPRNRLAQFARGTGALAAWAPSVDDGYVWAMSFVPDRSALVVGGSFSSIAGTSAYGMGKVDATTAVVLPWAANQRIRTAGAYGAITSIRTDGTQMYGSGYSFGSGAAFEGSFAADPATGAINWVNDCLGDTYDAYPFSGAVYTVSHAHDCTVIGAFPDVAAQALAEGGGELSAGHRHEHVPRRVRLGLHRAAQCRLPALVPRPGVRHLHKFSAGRVDGRRVRSVPGARWGVPDGQRGRPAGSRALRAPGGGAEEEGPRLPRRLRPGGVLDRVRDGAGPLGRPVGPGRRDAHL